MRPFRIGPEQNASFTDSVDHSHKGLAKKLTLKSGARRHGRLRQTEYSASSPGAARKNDAMAKQFADS